MRNTRVKFVTLLNLIKNPKLKNELLFDKQIIHVILNHETANKEKNMHKNRYRNIVTTLLVSFFFHGINFSPQTFTFL